VSSFACFLRACTTMLALIVPALFLGARANTKMCLTDALGCNKCETFQACAAYSDAVAGGAAVGNAPRDAILVERENAPDITVFPVLVDRSDPFSDVVTKTQRYFAHDGLDENSVIRFHFEYMNRRLEINDDDSMLAALALAAQAGETMVVSAFTLTDAPSMTPSTVPTTTPTLFPSPSPTPSPTMEFSSVDRHVVSPGSGFLTSWKVVPTFEDDPLEYVATGDGMTKVRFEFSIHGPNHGGIRLRDLDSGEIFGKEGTYGLDWQTTKPNIWNKRILQRVIQLNPGQTYRFVVEARSNSGSDDIQFHNGDGNQLYSGLWVALLPMRENYVFKWVPGWDKYGSSWQTTMTMDPMTFATDSPSVMVSLDASVYGEAHGGIRFLLKRSSDNAVMETYGTEGTYGYDWILVESNVWHKRFDQFIWQTNVAAGDYYFEVQVRAQGSGRAHAHGGGGTYDQQYSGAWFVAEEVDNYNAVALRHYGSNDIYTSTWTDFTGWSDPFVTRSGRFCFYLGIKVYGQPHGGCRLVNDNNDQWGDHATYGLDWMIVTENLWEKRGMLRTFEVEPEVEARYKLQCRSQGTGRFHTQSGTAGQRYAGIWFTLEEC